MSKTWRERLADREARGHWTTEDGELWMDMSTCPAAEVAARYGVESAPRDQSHGWGKLWALGHCMGVISAGAPMNVRLVGPHLFAQYLDRIEDLALKIKRESTP